MSWTAPALSESSKKHSGEFGYAIWPRHHRLYLRRGRPPASFVRQYKSGVTGFSTGSGKILLYLDPEGDWQDWVPYVLATSTITAYTRTAATTNPGGMIWSITW